MKKDTAHEHLSRIYRAMDDAILGATDEEIRQMVVENGESLSQIASKVQGIFNNALADSRRQKLTRAREFLNSKVEEQSKSIELPSIEKIKEIMLNLFKNDSTVRFAHRNFKTLPDNDWISMYKNFIKLGKIDPINHED